MHLGGDGARMGARRGIRRPQTALAGNFSARYSRIASDSQTCTSPSISTGTLPVPETGATRALKSGGVERDHLSSKAMPATFIAIHGRIDHDE